MGAQRLGRLTGLPVPLFTDAWNLQSTDAPSSIDIMANWERAISIAAATLVSVARASSVTSRAIEATLPRLGEPALGHWLTLVRGGIKAFERGHPPPDVLPLVTSLQVNVDHAPDLGAFADALTALGAGFRPNSRSLLDALDRLNTLRNRLFHHHIADLNVETRRALTVGYLAFVESVPLTGNLEVAVPERLTHDRLTLRRYHGPSPTCVDVVAATGTLPASAPMLLATDGSLIPLSPFAALDPSSDLGWFCGVVGSAGLAYRGRTTFSIAGSATDFLRAIGVDVSASTATPPSQPYRGLLSFEREHGGVFFGRAADAMRAASAVLKTRALLIAGPSGVGKSSLLKAGLLPLLAERVRETRGDVALREIIITPSARCGTDLSKAIETATTDPALPVIVAVDQLEGVYTLASSEERAAFVARLAEVAKLPGAYIVATLRADLLAVLLQDSTLAELLGQNLFIVRGIGRNELLSVIREPLRLHSRLLASDLAERVVADVGDHVGALALVSHVMSCLWAEHGAHGRTMTIDHYERAGGIGGAIRRAADEALLVATSGHPPHVVDGVLLELLTLTDDGLVVRRRPDVSSIAQAHGLDASKVHTLLEPFVERRLVVLDASDGRQVAEVAHEIIFAEWPHLAEKIALMRDAIGIRREIEAGARQWDRDRSSAALWRDDDGRLRRAERLVKSHALHLANRENEFLRASRRRVRRRALGSSFGVLTLAAATFALWMANERSADLARQRAAEQRRADLASIERGASSALELAEIPGRERDALERAILAGQGAIDADAPRLPVTVRALVAATTAAHTSRVIATGAAGFDVDGWGHVTALSHEGTVMSLPRWSRADTRVFGGAGTTITRLDEMTLVVAGQNDSPMLRFGEWSTPIAVIDESGDVLYRTSLPDNEVIESIVAVRDDDDETSLVVIATEGSLYRWEPERGTVLRHDVEVTLAPQPYRDAVLAQTTTGDFLRIDRTGVHDVVLSMRIPRGRLQQPASGELIVSVSEGDQAGVYVADLSTGGAKRVIATPATGAFASDDGRLLLVTVDPNDTRGTKTERNEEWAEVWSLAIPATRLTQLAGHWQGVADATFSPDGTLLVTASRDGRAIVWDTSTWFRLDTLRSTDLTPLTKVELGPDGSVFTMNQDGVIRAWRTVVAPSLASFQVQRVPTFVTRSGVRDLAFAGDHVLSLSGDDVLEVHHQFGGDRVAHLAQVRQMVAAPDRVLVVHAASGASLHSVPSLSPAAELTDDAVAAFGLDNGFGLISRSGVVTVHGWDGDTKAKAVLPSSQSFASAHACGVVDTDGVLHRFDGTTSSAGGDLSPDCKTVASYEDRAWKFQSTADDSALDIVGPDDFSDTRDPCDSVDLGSGVVYSPDNQRAVGGCPLAGVTLSPGEIAHELEGHAGTVRTALFSPDSRWLLTVGDADRSVIVWDTTTWRPILSALTGFEDAPYPSIHGIDTNHGLVAVGSFDNRSRLFAIPEDELLAHLRVYPNWYPTFCVRARLRAGTTEQAGPSVCTSGHFDVTHVVLSTDGRLLATGGPDGVVRIYPTDVAGAITVACRVASGLEPPPDENLAEICSNHEAPSPWTRGIYLAPPPFEAPPQPL